MIQVQAMRQFRLRLTFRRMMVVMAASMVVSALLVAFRVPPDPGYAYGTAGCLAIFGIACLANDHRDMGSAVVAVSIGILVGAPLVGDACTPAGLLIGPMVGYLARITTSRRPEGWTPAAPKVATLEV